MEEHHINIEGTMNQRYPNIRQSIIKDGCVVPNFNPECCIYRVHERLRKVKPKAYEPMVVSIGPYHLKNSKLQAMKKHKLSYLKCLLERINIRRETLILELEMLEDRVRKCYDEPIHLNSEKFVEMMLLDGCFIIEFFRQKTENNKLTVRWMKNQILNDLMLLENQLPFFLLSELYDMTEEKDDPEKPLTSLMVKSYFDRMLLPPSRFNAERRFEPQEIKHLLHLVHALFRPLPRPGQNEEDTRDETENEEDTRSQNEEDTRSQMHSAVELQEAGVKFKKVGKYYDDKTTNLFDIKFEDGLMEIPCFSVQDSTDTFFRNLIAFEQHSEDIHPEYFTDFAYFMDQLISSERDVKLLRHEGIICCLLGDDKEVSNFFNKLCDGVVLCLHKTYYSNQRKKVNKHCRKTWNKMRAKLMRDYFNSPWATVSTIAAAALLLLTLLQTIASVKTL